MDDFCGSKFWDSELTWHTDEPELTSCFEKTVLSWIPLGFLVIFGVIDAVRSFRYRKKPWSIPFSFLSTTKVSITTILIITEILRLSRALRVDEEPPVGRGADLGLVHIVSPAVQCVTYLAVLFLQLLSKRQGVSSSGIQLGFWFLVAICQLLPFRRTLTSINTGKTEDLATLLLELTYYPLIIIQGYLHCWAEKRRDKRGEESKADVLRPCPRAESSALSSLFFAWFDGLAWTGFRKPLVQSDLWDLDPEDTARVIVDKFDIQWEACANQLTLSSCCSQENPTVGVLNVLFRTFGGYFALGSFLTAIPDLLDIVAPKILSLLIAFISSDEELWKGYLYAFLLFLTTFVTVLTRAQYTHIVYMTGLRVKTALMSAVYRKALRISNSAKRDSTVGEIVNLMSVDVQKVLEVIPYINMAWSSPLQISIALYLLWGVVGPSILAGVAVMILLIPINGVLGNLGRIYQVAQLTNKDERVKLITEMIAGIKILKFYAWEESFKDQVSKIRKEEAKSLRKFATVSAVNEYLWFGSQFLVVLATFTTYVMLDERNVLDAHTVFVTLSLINVMTIPLTALPRMVILSIQAAVSVGRLNGFLNAPEVSTTDIGHDRSARKPAELIVVFDGTACAILLEKCNFTWNRGQSCTLEDINLRIDDGSLVAIVGRVGSGKSSLISAMLGELEKTRGFINTRGKVSYVAQQAWIQNATLRDNILFGKMYDVGRYNSVIRACGLLPDLDIFPARDATEIGERGLNLSGGQRQRISIARAVYNSADVYLLDDPLSAVDPQVAHHIFEQVVGPEGVLRGTTRVLVTHDISLLRSVDRIVVMKNGRISEVGTYTELLRSQGDFADYVSEYTSEETEFVDQDRMTKQISVQPCNFQRVQPKSKSFRVVAAEKAALDESRHRRMQRESFRISATAKKVLTGEEKANVESIPWSVYGEYFKAGSWKLMLPSFAMYFFYQGFSVAANAALTAWSGQPVINGTQADRFSYLGVYAGLGVLQSLVFLLAALFISFGALRGSSLLHSSMLERVLQAPMWFFDTTPTGRLINRFAKDVDVLDSSIATVLRLWMSVFVCVLATLAIVIYTVPKFIFVCIPAAVIYFFVQKLYIPTSRQLKRLESITQSPIYSYFSETISGVATIRAYGHQERFLAEALEKIDRNQACYFPSIVSNRWLSVRLEIIASFIKFFAALFAVLGRANLSPGLAGLSITYAINVTFYLGQLVRSFCDLETNIVAVERIKEYCIAPQEADSNTSHRKPPAGWPTSGAIEFNKYRTRYREGLDLVLKGVSGVIRPGEKIGVVGRTGAGKSSLAMALFRLIEGVDGCITIDGEDISKIGLRDLRSRITIIPQDPVLFSGTLRFNLDPFQKCSDEEVWKALELAHLRLLVLGFPGQLSHEIAEGGDNLSMGQKQLICLARALLHKSKILMLDEATASVDLETDSLIQETIRNEFRHCTVITIAHRLKTVMDCDRIMVMDQGIIREFDSPGNLLRVHNSLFHRMAKDAGLVRRDEF